MGLVVGKKAQGTFGKCREIWDGVSRSQHEKPTTFVPNPKPSTLGHNFFYCFIVNRSGETLRAKIQIKKLDSFERSITFGYQTRTDATNDYPATAQEL